MRTEIEIQRDYDSKTANQYNDMHCVSDDEHYFALHFMSAMIDMYEIKSILDIGAGTGRVALYLKSKFPGLKILSIEPVDALQRIGYEHGLSESELIDGDACNLKFNDMEFDLVCEFGVLHHIKNLNLLFQRC